MAKKLAKLATMGQGKKTLAPKAHGMSSRATALTGSPSSKTMKLTQTKTTQYPGQSKIKGSK